MATAHQGQIVDIPAHVKERGEVNFIVERVVDKMPAQQSLVEGVTGSLFGVESRSTEIS